VHQSIVVVAFISSQNLTGVKSHHLKLSDLSEKEEKSECNVSDCFQSDIV